MDRLKPKGIYVYILKRPSGEPFYVGMGRDRRMYEHEIQARSGRGRSHKLSVIRKILREGGNITYHIDSAHQCVDTAATREAELIRQIGRRDTGAGPLTNCTDGGEGVLGLSAERLAARGRKIAATLNTEACRTATGERSKRWHAANPSKTRQIIDRMQSLLRNDPDTKARWLASRRATFATPAVKVKLSAGLRRFRQNNPDKDAAMISRLVAWTKANGHVLSVCQRRFWASNPDKAAARAAAIRASRQTPEARKKTGEISKQLWTAERRAAFSADQRAKWADPEFKAKALAAVRAGSDAPGKSAIRSAVMRARWADPEYKARVVAKIADTQRRTKEVASGATLFG